MKKEDFGKNVTKKRRKYRRYLQRNYEGNTLLPAPNTSNDGI